MKMKRNLFRILLIAVLALHLTGCAKQASRQIFAMDTVMDLTLTGARPEETLQELAHRCTFFDTRTIGSFQVLGYEDILAIYRMANY